MKEQLRVATAAMLATLREGRPLPYGHKAKTVVGEAFRLPFVVFHSVIACQEKQTDFRYTQTKGSLVQRELTPKAAEGLSFSRI